MKVKESDPNQWKHIQFIRTAMQSLEKQSKANGSNEST